MSLAVSRSDGVMVLSLTSDPSSACPPLCQLLGALCYSPGLCSGSRRLVPQRGGPLSALGALWMISGIMHIGLGTILITTRGADVWSMRFTYCPVWFGVLCLLFGASCVLSERQRRPVLVLLNILLNLVGFALAMTCLVWYSASGMGFYDWCDRHNYNYYYFSRRTTTTTTMPPDQNVLMSRCKETRDLLQQLVTSLRVIMIILSVLGLGLSLGSFIVSIKSLRRNQSKDQASQ